MYVYIYLYVCVCVYVCMCVRARVCTVGGGTVILGAGKLTLVGARPVPN